MLDELKGRGRHSAAEDPASIASAAGPIPDAIVWYATAPVLGPLVHL